MEQTTLILGATSGIAIATARHFAAAGHNLVLAARDCNRLQELQAELQRNVSVELAEFDALDFQSHEAFYTPLKGRIDVAVVAFGLLLEEEHARTDLHETLAIVQTNYVGVTTICNLIAADMAGRGKGTIVGISSVAGDRGRKRNYLYGSAKAGMTAYLSGLRNSMAEHNVHVSTVNPGWVNTRMIEGIDTVKALTAEPEQVAKSIYRKAYRGKQNMVYVKPIWRLIMWVIRNIPEPIFKRSNF